MNSKKQMRVGFLGTGWSEEAQVPAFREAGCVVAALYGRNKARSKKICEDYQIECCAADENELIEKKDLDLICVTLPPFMHKEFTIKALQAGKHVLCEKPFAMNSKEAEEMLTIAKKYPSQLSIIDHELRYLSSFVEAKRILTEEKSLGTIYTIRGENSSEQFVSTSYHWWHESDKGGGVLYALGSHYIDLMCWLISSSIQAVNGDLKTIIKKRKDDLNSSEHVVTSDDYCNVNFDFENGIVGSLYLDVNKWGDPRNEIVINGSKGTMVLDFIRGGFKMWNDKKELIADVKEEALYEFNNDLNCPPIWLAATKAFVQQIIKFWENHVDDDGAIKDKEMVSKTFADFERGLYVQKVLDAIKLASQTKTVQKI